MIPFALEPMLLVSKENYLRKLLVWRHLVKRADFKGHPPSAEPVAVHSGITEQEFSADPLGGGRRRHCKGCPAEVVPSRVNQEMLSL